MATGSLGDMNDSEKNEIERKRRLVDRFHDLYSNGVKGLVFLNSAGVAAMLGFIQALVGKTGIFLAFKPFGITAVVAFLIGATVGSALFVTRMYSLAAAKPEVAYRWERTGLRGIYATLVFFVAGACAIVAGLIAAT